MLLRWILLVKAFHPDRLELFIDNIGYLIASRYARNILYHDL